MNNKFFLVAGLAVAIFTTGCENKSTGSDAATAENIVASENTEPAIDNPNIASEGASVSSENAPVMSFEETEYNFGTIKQGEVIKHTFEFTNTGKSPLIIENASATCGCTVPEWPKEPIAPGETGEIAVQFNSSGKVGQQYPTVTVRANTEPNIVKISMKGNVETSGVPTAGAEGPVKRN